MTIFQVLQTYMADFYASQTGGLTGCTRSCSGRDEELHRVASENSAQASVESLQSAPSAAQTAKNTLIRWSPTFAQEMIRHDSTNWQMANWSNGNPFASAWHTDNVIFRGGIMILQLDNFGCPSNCDSKAYASGEYRTIAETFGHGYYETRMQAGAGDGLVSSFFIYRGTHGHRSHDEIDLEVLGRDCNRIQTNYYVEGQGNHERMIDLGFNACTGFHNYGIEWRADRLVWYVEGREVRRINEDEGTIAREIPYRAGKIMVNFWPGQGVESWLGNFSYPGVPLTAQYDWIRYSNLERQAGQLRPTIPGRPAASISATPSTASISPLQVSELQTSFYAFNGGSASRRNEDNNTVVYVFSADHARDPGFGIRTGDRDLVGRNSLRFEIKGRFEQHGISARMVAQVYNQDDDESSPSLSYDPVVLSGEWAELTIDLRSQIQRAHKIQFVLLTDNGSCEIEVRNLRFE